MGGDAQSVRNFPACHSFNPRLRVGGDEAATFSRDMSHVSIHASAWEATTRGVPDALSSTQFQSTPPRGRRPVVVCPKTGRCGFQSTPPRGRRRGRPQPARIKVLRGPFRESAVWRCPAFRIFYSYTIIVLYSNMLDVSRIFLQKAVNLRSPLQKINGPSGS